MIDMREVITAPEEWEIYEKYRDKFPFPVVEFARDLGIKVVSTRDFPDHISGAIRMKDGEYVIYVNGQHYATRQRFTIAHELGHYFEDREYLAGEGEIFEYIKKDNSLFRRDDREPDANMIKMDIRANKVAAELLMPAKKIQEVWSSESKVWVNEYDLIMTIAEFFDVSLTATTNRISNVLGKICQ